MIGKPNMVNLIAAFDALSSVPDKNFSMVPAAPGPFQILNGKCPTVNDAMGWVAQYPHFTQQGVTYEPSESGRMRVVCRTSLPRSFPTAGVLTYYGYGALAYALGLSYQQAARVFYRLEYNAPETVTIKEVVRRLKTVITKVGGKDALDAHIKASKPPKVPKPKTVAKKRPAKKAKKKPAAKK